MDKIRIVLTNGTHRDFNTAKVFTSSDIKELVNDVLVFVQLHGEVYNHKIHSWYPVHGHEIIDSKPV